MEQFLENKTAIVTGGTRGIGFAIAEALARAGAAVAICGRAAQATEEAVTKLADVSKGKVVGFAADVSKPGDVSRFFGFVDRELGAPDILINNAGVGRFRSVAALSVEDWQSVINTNLCGVFYCCHEALSRFHQRGGGYVINLIGDQHQSLRCFLLLP
jgi:NAD(P)-dependent dehydrogenase (short-subunit alcohol dehydrogenase family)